MITHNGKQVTLAMRNRKAINLIARNGKAMFGEYAQWLHGIDAAARAVILAEYGKQVWSDVRDYAKAHPQIVEFINQDPHLACSISPNSNKERWLDNGGSGANINTGIPRLLKNTYKFSGLANYANVTDRQLNGAQGYVYFGVVSNGYQIAGGGNAVALTGAKAGANIDFEVFFDCPQNKVSAVVNGATYNASSVGYTETPSDATLWLFSLNDKVLPSNCKISKWSIEVNGEQIADFVPYLQNGVAGMLDLVTYTFHPNANTQGAFTIAITDKE